MRNRIARLLSRWSTTGTRANPSDADQALATATDLVKANRDLEAIELLTEANRRQRDARLERRLVDLRVEAFRRVEWPESPEPGPEVEDLFPGELIPEVRFADLTAELLHSAISHHGSMLVRGVVGPDHVDRLVRSIDTAFAGFAAQNGVESNGDAPSRPDVDDWYRPMEIHGVSVQAKLQKQRGGALYAVESPPALFDLIEILTEVGLGRLAHDYLGEPPMILARKVTLRRMPVTASGGWHQDGAFMGKDLRALNVWLALSQCGIDAPSLDVVGRRVDWIVETGGHSRSAAYAVSAELAEEVGAGTIVRPVFEPGDCLIFDHLCLHRTGGGAGMKRGRYAIESWFMAPSTYGAMTAPVEEGFQPFDQQPLVF